MAYLGRFQLGQTIPLRLQCKDASDTPTLPDRAPQAKIFSGGSTRVATALMPIENRYKVTGEFRLPLFLNSTYAVGKYQVVYYYNCSTFHGVEEDTFEIVGGGSATGHIDSAYFYERPEANYVVYGKEGVSGGVAWQRNPTV